MNEKVGKNTNLVVSFLLEAMYHDFTGSHYEVKSPYSHYYTV